MRSLIIFGKEALILYVNIRSRNANFEKFEIFLESLKIKLIGVMCTEIWNFEYYQYFGLDKYKIYYNNSTLNQNDGVVIYI